MPLLWMKMRLEKLSNLAKITLTRKEQALEPRTNAKAIL